MTVHKQIRLHLHISGWVDVGSETTTTTNCRGNRKLLFDPVDAIAIAIAIAKQNELRKMKQNTNSDSTFITNII